MNTSRFVLAGAAAAAAALLATTGCSSSSGHGAAARSAAASLTANPAYQQDSARLQALLLANFKKDFTYAHPVTSMMTAVRDTFPNGSTQAIVNYAVKTFTLKAAKAGPERQAWIQGVVTFALNHGAAAGIPSGAASPSIPGVTLPASSKSPST